MVSPRSGERVWHENKARANRVLTVSGKDSLQCNALFPSLRSRGGNKAAALEATESSACRKDHDKSMPTPLKLIMTCVRKMEQSFTSQSKIGKHSITGDFDAKYAAIQKV